jgi:hypothetical protein
MNQISEKQLKANQENAKQGGVKTEQGKAISRLNALKHGLLTKEILLKDENENDLIDLGKKIRSQLKPVNEIENILVERIVVNTWRLKRLLKAEKEMIECDMSLEKNFGSALSYDFANYDSYGKITRYESCIERGLYKALHELQRIQAKREGGEVPAPMALDVNVSEKD